MTNRRCIKQSSNRSLEDLFVFGSAAPCSEVQGANKDFMGEEGMIIIKERNIP